MGISFRIYLIADDGTLKRVPRRICEALPSDKDAIPEYAGTRQRMVQVIIENEDGRPARILEATGHFWTFDAEGKIDEGLRESLGAFMEAAFARPRDAKDKVIDLLPEIRKKELHERHRWPVTKEDLDWIAVDLQARTKGRAAEMTTVKGSASKKPPLPTEGKWALDDIEKNVAAIAIRLGGLSERALKGLAFEAHRMSTLEDEAIWRGVAEEAKRCEAIRAAHRTGRGEWYAVLEVMRDDPNDPIIRHHVVTEHVKAASRKAAVEAGRKLMAEKIEWLGEGTIVEVTVRSALEWRPEEWG